MDTKHWSLSLLTHGEIPLVTMNVFDTASVERNGIRVTLTHKTAGDIHFFEARAAADHDAEVYFSLNRTDAPSSVLAFTGEVNAREIFRQSPHDVERYHFDMTKQPVPMGACSVDGGYEVALCDAPYYSDNYTTQEFVPAEHRFSICSGDSGRKPGRQGDVEFVPYYHKIDKQTEHVFRFLIFFSPAKSLSRLRLDTFRAVVSCFGNGSTLYHAICFATNYMHLRRNETGKSKCWVVAGIEYCNTQYRRDSFWQSMILPAKIDRECYSALPEECREAENSLIQVLWAYRLFKRGDEPIWQNVNTALSYIRSCTKDGFFHPQKDNLGRCDFRSWFDLCAHTETDAITYNQGMYATAMHCAWNMGLATEEEYQLSVRAYRSMFIKELGIYPVSREKVALCVDPLVGDLLHRMLFGEHLLPCEDVISHYRTVCARCSTPYGIKVSAELDGSYHPKEFFGIPGYLNDYYDTNPSAAPGHYIWGSSYFIYEMLFHIDALLQGASEAEQRIIDRTLLDFSLGSTYFEHIDTVTGEPDKANQGWNAAVYAIWKQLVEEGAVSDRYLTEMENYLYAIE